MPDICYYNSTDFANLLTEVNGMGMKMAKRPNSKSHKDGVFVEPVWIWKK